MKPSAFRIASLAVWVLCALASGWPVAAQVDLRFTSSRLPGGIRVFGSAIIADDGSGLNNCLHLTEPEPSAFGAIRIPDVAKGRNVDRILVSWRSLIGSTNVGADGYSFNWADDLPNPPAYYNPGEEGAGSGLTVAVDTFYDGGPDGVGLEINWKGQRVAFASVPKEDPGSGGPYLRRNRFVDAELTVTPAGLATFRYDGVMVQAALEGWTGIQGGAFEFGARTSGITDTNVFTDRHWIDDLRIETRSFLPGTFAGLFLEEQSPAHDQSGFVTLKLNASGAFSGTLWVAGKRLPLTGTFNPTNRSARVSVARTGSAALTVDLQLTDADAVEGRVSDGVWEVPLRADRQVWSKQSRPLPAFLATRHTFYLPASDQPDLAPGGHGIGTLRVDAGGLVTLSGRLGEGTPVTQRVALAKTGLWPFYVSFQGGKGAAFGWIQAREPEELFGFSGRVTVTKIPDARAARYPSGFSQETTLLAAPYVAPARGTPVLSVSNTVVSFSGGNLGYDFASQIALTLENKILDLSTNTLKMKLSPASGVYSGTVINPSTGRSLSFRGIVLRPPGLAPGQFLGATESGGVVLGNNVY